MAADTEWERRVHEVFQIAYPCELQPQFENLWEELESELEDEDVTGQLDADPALARCLWCLVGHLQPRAIVETGVARGISSRTILEGLERQGSGHLWSVDLPALRNPWWSQAASAVPGPLRARWTYLRGDSKRLLPRMLKDAAPVDIFVHDSVHDDGYMTFEIESALRSMRRGGVLVVDDVDHGHAFEDAVGRGRFSDWYLCPHENKSGVFGIAVKA